jgi:hypothetical protein
LKGRKNDDVEAPILCPALGGVIISDGMELAVPRGRKVTRRKPVLRDQKLNQIRCPGSGELPIRGKSSSVNGDIIGMSLDAKIFRPLFEDYG